MTDLELLLKQPDVLEKLSILCAARAEYDRLVRMGWS